MDIKRFRKEFPVTKKYAFLDHACIGPLSRRAAENMRTFVEDMHRHGGIHEDLWIEEVEKARGLTACLLGCSKEEVSFTKNTSEGISFVANGLDWETGDNVVITQIEFPANVYSWMNLKRKGVEVRFVQEAEGRIPFEGIEAAIDDKTYVVSLSFVEFTTGFRNDLKKIGELCKEKGIIFVVDAIQGLGALRLDVKEMGIDFLAADGHKWLMAPEGAGIFYARRGALDWLKVKEVGWASVVNKEDYLSYDLTLRPDSSRFECGSLSTVCFYGLKGALELLLEAGIGPIEDRILDLTNHLCKGLTEKGYIIYSSRREGETSGIVSFYSDKHDNSQIWKGLRERGIILSLRDGRLRAAPHFYNTHEEVDRLLKYLP
ncbi:MAG TPA: aminotransferase class V-fold PLP-dependent enzyme [Candidatus Hypogeohydataceae bacterium YC41]